MIRPRHREKSSLLWKMLGVAGVINLVLWPVLIHEGVFTGIHQEVLIPVTLVSLPPSLKSPDALRIVARAPLARFNPLPERVRPGRVIRKPAAPTHLSLRPASGKQPGTTLGMTALKILPQKPSPVKPVLASVTRLARPADPVPPASHAPLRVAQVKPMRPVGQSPRPAPKVVDFHPALAARIARARQLEAEGHRVAEWIAQQRGEREAALPPPAETVALPPAVPTTPVAVAAAKATPHVTEKILGKPQSHRSLSRLDVPAVAIRKEHPVVPDAMMKSPWHATFQGEFTVLRDGTPVVRMVSSTGFPTLDRRAIQAARRWKFRPARRNGVSVASVQSFSFEYDVHPVR